MKIKKSIDFSENKSKLQNKNKNFKKQNLIKIKTLQSYIFSNIIKNSKQFSYK